MIESILLSRSVVIVEMVSRALLPRLSLEQFSLILSSLALANSLEKFFSPPSLLRLLGQIPSQESRGLNLPLLLSSPTSV
jgi:hypothetical protein